MNWDDLRFFLALAREGTVSGAGRTLNVKHTTVARRIAALEEQLGSRLFDRMPSGYGMTQVGENLMPHALGVEELVNAADREVFGMDTQLSGSLKIAASYDMFSRLVTPRLSEFKRKFPLIDIELVSSTGLVDLGSRQADIALRISPKPPEQLVGRRVVSLGHGVYGTEEYLRNNRDTEQLILWGYEKNKPEWVVDHFPDADVALRTSEVLTMMEAVKNNLGIARLPCYVADADPELRRLDLELTPSEWGMWVLSHADLRSTARVRACREFLIKIIEEQRALVEGVNSHYFRPSDKLP